VLVESVPNAPGAPSLALAKLQEKTLYRKGQLL
jgi:hypothetical protein